MRLTNKRIPISNSLQLLPVVATLFTVDRWSRRASVWVLVHCFLLRSCLQLNQLTAILTKKLHLRTRAAQDPLQFTRTKQAEPQLEPATAVIAERELNYVQYAEEHTKPAVPRDNKADMQCSPDDPESCEACGSWCFKIRKIWEWALAEKWGLFCVAWFIDEPDLQSYCEVAPGLEMDPVYQNIIKSLAPHCWNICRS